MKLKRVTSAKPKRDALQQTVADLAARVKWLEECQRVNIKTVEALHAQVRSYANTVNLWASWANKRFINESVTGLEKTPDPSNDPVRRVVLGLVYLAMATSGTGVLVATALLMRWF